LIIRRAANLIGVSSGVVYTLEAQVLVPRAWWNLGPWMSKVRFPLGEGIPGIVARDGEARAVREAFKRGAEDYVLKQELDTISLFDVIGSAIERRRQKEEILQAQAQLRQLAERDGLTGLFNHRYLLEVLEKEFTRAKRYGRPFSLLMIDLDGFKSINDTCGHLKGDRVLKQVARLIEKTTRSVDIIARYGGDEFVVLLPETPPRQAITIGERIVRDLKRHPFHDEGKNYPLSASVGIAAYSPSAATAGALLKEADEALYAAKRNGRSQVIFLKSIRSTEKPRKEAGLAATRALTS